MGDEPTDEPTQRTQPRPRKKGKPMPEPFDIPIPSEDQVARDFLKVALAGRTTEDETEERENRG